MRLHRVVFLLSCVLLAACGGDKAGAEGAPGEDGLPRPAAASGSVTGMPNPGVADTRPEAAAAQETDIAELPEPVDGDADDITATDPGLPTDPMDATPASPEPPAMQDPETPASPPTERAQAEPAP